MKGIYLFQALKGVNVTCGYQIDGDAVSLRYKGTPMPEGATEIRFRKYIKAHQDSNQYPKFVWTDWFKIVPDQNDSI